MKLAQPKVQTPPTEIAQEAIPSTDELSALLEKRYVEFSTVVEWREKDRYLYISSRMLLNERSKYQEIQEKMKKKKLENGLFARDIERLEEQLTAKKAKINKNNLFLQYWEKQVQISSYFANLSDPFVPHRLLLLRRISDNRKI